MELIKVVLWICLIALKVSCLPHPEHVHHRIIVPHKIKTIHHTKIIKVPEHHHYFHEKEKIVQIETKHKKEKVHPLPLEDEDDDWSDSYLGSSSHNIFKKHIPSTTERSRKRNIRNRQKRRKLT